MPPVKSLAQRFIFYDFSGEGIDSADTFWSIKGKEWAHGLDHFIGSSSAVKDRAMALTAGGTTQDARLRALYAEVMSLDNTDLTRTHRPEEDSAAGGRTTREAADVLRQRRGSSSQLALLFVALARASGFKAYVMRVTNRDRNVFLPTWLSFDQLDDDIAIVEVDGKERFFDPGTRFCPYGQLDWKHTATGGPRQTDKDVEIATTPLNGYKESQTTRIADLTLDASGRAVGSLTLTWIGAPAIELRQRAARTDDAEVRTRLETLLKELLPRDAEVAVQSIDNLTDGEKPLIAHTALSVMVASAAGSRHIAPSQLFQSRQEPLFPSETRTIPVYFPYPERVADVVRYKLPTNWVVEGPSVPTELRFADMASYKATMQTGPNTVILRRDYVLGSVVAFPREYSELRKFFSGLAVADQQRLVFATGTAK